MPLTQTTVVTTKDVDGNEVKVLQDTLEQVLRAKTTDGKDVFVNTQDDEATLETSVSIVFDDLVEGEPNTLSWTTQEGTPDDTARILTVGFWNGEQKIFSHPHKAGEYCFKLKPLLSPRERAANVINISEYRGKQ